ncbi:MAG: antibiotic biosynthesis monooxygenase family protein [Pseudomonadota bacterium]
MAATILLEVTAKAGTGDKLVEFFKSILVDTRAYDGCKSVDVYRNMDSPDVVVLVEQWESKAHYEKYLGWRSETGVVDQIVSQIDGAPSIRYFDLTDA